MNLKNNLCGQIEKWSRNGKQKKVDRTKPIKIIPETKKKKKKKRKKEKQTRTTVNLKKSTDTVKQMSNKQTKQKKEEKNYKVNSRENFQIKICGEDF